MAVKPSTFAGPTGSSACLGLHPSAFRTSGRAYGLLGRAVQKVLEGCSPKQCLAWVSSVVPTAYATKKSPHKRAPSSWFWHLRAVASSLQKVFREGAPLCGDAGGIVPVGSKGAALRGGAGCAPRLLPSLAPWAMPPAMPPAPVLGRGRAVVPQGPVPTVGQAQGWPRGQTAQQQPGAIRALESRYFGSVRHPLVLSRCFHRKQAAKGGQTCIA